MANSHTASHTRRRSFSIVLSSFRTANENRPSNTGGAHWAMPVHDLRSEPTSQVVVVEKKPGQFW